MHSVYLLTGSNLGNRALQLGKCKEELNLQAGTIVDQSPIFETEAWGVEGLPAHFNQALLLQTALPPSDLLRVIHHIECLLGRIRQEKWGIRSIDIDIIYFDHQIVNLPELTIPHPLMQERNFVLKPLVTIAPDFRHPVLGKTNKELLEICQDQLIAKIL